jgi:outer membrane protein assembly factor BamA
MRFMLASLLLALCVSGACSFAHAQQPTSADSATTPAAAAPSVLQARLDSVSVVGSKRFPADKIVAAMGLKAGSMVTRVDLQKAADSLSALGPFSTVKYRFASPPSGLRVEFAVEDAPGLPIRFDNFPWVSDDELTAALKSAVPLCDGTAPPGGAILDTMGTAIELFLEKKDVFARVSHSAMTDPLTDEPMQTFLAAGPAQDVKSVEFSDALALANRGIQDRLKDLIGKPYSRTALEVFEVEQVRPVYLSRGLLKIRFSAPVIKAAAATPGDAKAPSDVTVQVAIEAGPAYTWVGAIFNGNVAVSTTELAALVNLKPGDVADGMRIAGLWTRLTDDYGHHGYLDAKVTPQPQFDDQAHSVGYKVAISEGMQYHMGTLKLTGLSTAGEQRVREAWSIKEGAVFDQAFLDQFLESGAKNSFVGIPYTYERVGHFLDKDSTSGKVDVMIDFQ